MKRNQLNIKNPKKRRSKLKVTIISVLSLAAIAVPTTLITLKFLPDYMSATKKEDKKAYSITRQTINDKGQEEITLKTKYDTYEVDGAIKITKGDVELKRSAEPEGQNIVLEDSKTNEPDGDYYFDKKNQTFIIFKKTLEDIPGQIHLEPKVIEKVFICRIEREGDTEHKNNPNLIYGDKNTKYPIKFYKDGEDISNDITDPVSVSLAGKSGEYASIEKDDKGFPYLVLKDDSYFGKITLTATRYNHKLVDEEGNKASSILLEVASYDKLNYDKKENNELDIGLTDTSATSGGLSINVAIPNRWWIPSETNPNIGNWHTVTGIRDYGFANTNKEFINLKIHDFDSIDNTSSDPNKITHIGKAAFSNNSSLISIDLSNLSCKELPDKDDEHPGLFEGCSKLLSNRKNFKLPQAAKYIPKGAFIGCNGFTDLDFLLSNESITEIGDEAFRDCSNLGYVDAKTSVAITFPKQLKRIGDKAFYNCNKIQSLEINCNINYIGEDCFSTGNENGKELPITNIKFLGGNDDVTGTIETCRSKFEVGKNAFANNKVSYIFLDSVVVARADSFKCEKYIAGDTKLYGNDSHLFDKLGTDLIEVEVNKINVSEKIKDLESNGGAYTSYFNRHFECRGKVYDKNYNNHEVRLSEYLDFEVDGNNNATISLKKEPVYCPTEIEIPSTYSLMGDGKFNNVNITKIKEGGFAKNDKGDISRNKITKISFKDNNNITDIPKNAFNGQASLSTVNLNGNKKYSINEGAFNGCTSYSNNNIFDYLKELNGPNIFKGTQISSANLKNITSVWAPENTSDDGVFSGMNSLTSITNIGNTTYYCIKTGTFNGCSTVTNVAISLPLLTSSTIQQDAFKGLGSYAEGKTINLHDNYKYWARCDKNGNYLTGVSDYCTFSFGDTPETRWNGILNNTSSFRWRTPSTYVHLYIRKGDQRGDEPIYSESTGRYYGYFMDNGGSARNYEVICECSGPTGCFGNTIGCNTSFDNLSALEIVQNYGKGNYKFKAIKSSSSCTITAAPKDNPSLRQSVTFDIAADWEPSSKNVSVNPYLGEYDGLSCELKSDEWWSNKTLFWYWWRRAFHTTQKNMRSLSLSLIGDYLPLDTTLYIKNANRRDGLLHIYSFAFTGYNGDHWKQIKLGESLNVYLVGTTCGTVDITVSRHNYYDSGGTQICKLTTQAG